MGGKAVYLHQKSTCDMCARTLTMMDLGGFLVAGMRCFTLLSGQLHSAALLS